MIRVRLDGVAAAVLLTGALSMPLRAVAEGDATTQLLKEAAALDKAGKGAEAHAKLEQAWRSEHRYDVAAALGMNERKAGNFAHAAQHLEWAIRFLPDAMKPTERQQIIDAFTDVRSKVGAIRLRVLPRGSGIKIDGETPELLGIDYDVFVMPGSRVVDVPNHPSQTIDAQADASYAVSADQPAAADEGHPKEAALAPVAEKPSSRPVWPAVVLGTLAAGGAAVGIGMTVVAQKKSSDAQEIADSDMCKARDASGAPSSACVHDGANAVSDHNTFQAVGIAGFVGCGVALTATLVYALYPSGSSPPKDTPTVNAMIDPLDGSGYFAVGGRF
jgi:hypothetical protein